MADLLLRITGPDAIQAHAELTANIQYDNLDATVETVSQNVMPWLNDAIQFPRLLAEIMATVEFTARQRKALAETMDLSWDDICEVFDRAQAAWERRKEEVR